MALKTHDAAEHPNNDPNSLGLATTRRGTRLRRAMNLIALLAVPLILAGCDTDRISHYHSDPNQKLAEEASTNFEDFVGQTAGLAAVLGKDIEARKALETTVSDAKLQVLDTELATVATDISWQRLRLRTYDAVGLLNDSPLMDPNHPDQPLVIDVNDPSPKLQLSKEFYQYYDLLFEERLASRQIRLRAAADLFNLIAAAQRVLVEQAKTDKAAADKDQTAWQQKLADASKKNADAAKAAGATATSSDASQGGAAAAQSVRQTATKSAKKQSDTKTAADDARKKRVDFVVSLIQTLNDIGDRLQTNQAVRARANELQARLMASVADSRDPAAAFILVAVIGTGLDSDSLALLDAYLDNLAGRLEKLEAQLEATEDGGKFSIPPLTDGKGNPVEAWVELVVALQKASDSRNLAQQAIALEESKRLVRTANSPTSFQPLFSPIGVYTTQEERDFQNAVNEGDKAQKEPDGAQKAPAATRAAQAAQAVEESRRLLHAAVAKAYQEHPANQQPFTADARNSVNVQGQQELLDKSEEAKKSLDMSVTARQDLLTSLGLPVTSARPPLGPMGVQDPKATDIPGGRNVFREINARSLYGAAARQALAEQKNLPASDALPPDALQKLSPIDQLQSRLRANLSEGLYKIERDESSDFQGGINALNDSRKALATSAKALRAAVEAAPLDADAAALAASVVVDVGGQTLGQQVNPRSDAQSLKLKGARFLIDALAANPEAAVGIQHAIEGETFPTGSPDVGPGKAAGAGPPAGAGGAGSDLSMSKQTKQETGNASIDQGITLVGGLVDDINRETIAARLRIQQFLAELNNIQLDLREENVRHSQSMYSVAEYELRRWQLVADLNSDYGSVFHGNEEADPVSPWLPQSLRPLFPGQRTLRRELGTARDKWQSAERKSREARRKWFEELEAAAERKSNSSTRATRVSALAAAARHAELVAENYKRQADRLQSQVEDVNDATSARLFVNPKEVVWAPESKPPLVGFDRPSPRDPAGGDNDFDKLPKDDKGNPPHFRDPVVTPDNGILNTLNKLRLTAKAFHDAGSGPADPSGWHVLASNARLFKAVRTIHGHLLIASMNSHLGEENAIRLRTELAEHDLHLDDFDTRLQEAGFRLTLGDLKAFHSSGITDNDIRSLETIFLGLIATK